MPRIHNEGPLVSQWHKRTEEGSGTADVCRSCWNEILEDPTRHQLKLWEGCCISGEPSQFWLAVGEPPEPFDQLDYDCAICDKRLGYSDNANGRDDRRADAAMAKAIKDRLGAIVPAGIFHFDTNSDDLLSI